VIDSYTIPQACHDMILVGVGVYALFYTIGGEVWLRTILIEDDGTIGAEVDSQQVEGSGSTGSNIVYISGNVYAVTRLGTPTTNSYLETWSIITVPPDTSTYPINPLLRVSGIVRTFWAGVGGQSVYQTVLTQGGISTSFVSPIGSRDPVGAVTAAPEPSGPGYQQSDYQVWLNYYITYNLAGLLKTFGHIPSYEEWIKWKQYGILP